MFTGTMPFFSQYSTFSRHILLAGSYGRVSGKGEGLLLAKVIKHTRNRQIEIVGNLQYMILPKENEIAKVHNLIHGKNILSQCYMTKNNSTF